MSDFQAIADRVEIEALRGEFTDAVMMRDYGRVASLFTPDGALRMPNVPVDLAGREEIRAWGEQGAGPCGSTSCRPRTRARSGWTATPRPAAPTSKSSSACATASSELNYAIYHDRYQRTGDGWKFTERVYEIRYLDTSPLAGSAPRAAGSGRR